MCPPPLIFWRYFSSESSTVSVFTSISIGHSRSRIFCANFVAQGRHQESDA
jgi:hypothetical protein